MEYKEYLKWHGFALKMIGLWPTSSTPNRRPLFFFFSGYNLYSFLLLGVFCLAFNVSEFANFFYIYGELDAFASDLCWFLVHSVGNVKIVMFLAKIKDLQFIQARFLNRDYLQSLKDRQTLSKAIQKSRRLLTVYYLLTLVALVNAFIAPIFRDNQIEEENEKSQDINLDYNSTNYKSNSYILPYYTYVFCDPVYSPCFEIAYSYQILSTTLLSLVIIHCDNFYILYVMLCCSEFEILRGSLKNLTERARLEIVRSRNGNNNNHDEVAEQDLIDRETLRLGSNCVKHHNDILEVSEKLEAIYNFSLLAQFLTQLVQLCFQMFLVTEISTITFDALSMIGFVITMLIQIYVFCWLGNEIETESKKVAEAAYNAEWISCPKSLKTTLMLVTLRAQRPVQFSIGKFGNLSMETFVSVLKGSFSYFMVLREMQ